MGAGKTTLIKALAKAFEYYDPISSLPLGLSTTMKIINQEEFFKF